MKGTVFWGRSILLCVFVLIVLVERRLLSYVTNRSPGVAPTELKAIMNGETEARSIQREQQIEEGHKVTSGDYPYYSYLLHSYHPPINDSLPSWDVFRDTLKINNEGILTKVTNDWRYLEDFCLIEDRKGVYVFNYGNRTIPSKKYPNVMYPWLYKKFLYFHNSTEQMIPATALQMDSLYVFMTRGWGGWNNIYHHTEWIHNLMRYQLHRSTLPQMRTVVYYPDLYYQNQTFGDPKGHFRWAQSYYAIAKSAFDATSPSFVEGEDYWKHNRTICAKRGILASIVPSMYDTFVSIEEPRLMRYLTYQYFHYSIRDTISKQLSVLYLDRNGGNRGIKNRDALLHMLQRNEGIRLTVQPSGAYSFKEQIDFVLHKDVFISLHGAALTHILFMEPFSGVIEINPPFFNEPFYKNMAKKCQMLFFGLYKTFSDDMKKSKRIVETAKKLNQWFTVPEVMFNETIRLAFDEVKRLKYRIVHVV